MTSYEGNVIGQSAPETPRNLGRRWYCQDICRTQK